MPSIQIKAKGPEKFDSRRLQARLLNLLKDYLRKMQFDLDSVTLTWNHQPSWRPELHYAGGDMYIRITTEDPVFGYLDEGTSIRWAVMSRDFRAKTEVRSFGSFPGSGRAVIRGRGAMTSRGIAPRPGITAREWTKLITEIREVNLQLDVEEIIREELGFNE